MMLNEDLRLEVKGLELCRKYYEDIGKPVFQEKFAQYWDKAAVGLVGEGSECFGFDDFISRDHDYGPSFCVWLPQDVYAAAGAEMKKAYAMLPKEYGGVAVQLMREQNTGRRGIHEINRFYTQFLGQQSVPRTLIDWLRIPEHYFAVATNGEVYEDNLGEFTRIRNALLAYYPEDVRLKKIAAKAITMAHTGQCNFGRMMCRYDAVAARLALDDFIRAAIAMVYLLNKKYAPYYKWMWRGMENLEKLPRVRQLLRELADMGAATEADAWTKKGWQGYPFGVNTNSKAVNTVEEICALIIGELRRQGISGSRSDYLEAHAFEALSRIGDRGIRSLSVFVG